MTPEPDGLASVGSQLASGSPCLCLPWLEFQALMTHLECIQMLGIQILEFQPLMAHLSCIRMLGIRVLVLTFA